MDEGLREVMYDKGRWRDKYEWITERYKSKVGRRRKKVEECRDDCGKARRGYTCLRDEG